MAVPDFYAKVLGDCPAGYRTSLTCWHCGFIRSLPFAELIESL